MTKFKLVPVEPTREMIAAAEEAHMPFGDMDIGIRLAILAAPSPWISVGERLPEPETDVLVCNQDCYSGELLATVAGLFRGVWMSQETEDNLRFAPSYWMPLPEAPEVK